MTAPARFRLSRHLLVPRWLTEDEGLLVGYSLDLLKDAFVERLRLGLLARFPQNGPNGETAPSDALAALGRDRRVVRGIDETEVSYAARLLRWLDDRKTAGSPFAVMARLREYLGADSGCSFRTVDARGNWYSLAADGTTSVVPAAGNWNWDGIPATQWARYWVIIYPGTRWTALPTWGSVDGPAWGTPGVTWGSTATPTEVDILRAVVADWKPGGMTCVNIILAFLPATFDPAAPEPNGTWGHWSHVALGICQAPTRLITARYVDGV